MKSRLLWVGAIASLLLVPAPALPAAVELPVPSTLIEASSTASVSSGESRAWVANVSLGDFERHAALSRATTDDPVVWVRLDIPELEPLVLELERNYPLAGGGTGWVGRWADEDPGRGVFVVRGNQLFGSFRRRGMNLQVRPAAGGSHRIVEWDENSWVDDAVDFVPVWTPPDAIPGTPAPAAPGDSIIDVLVVYTPATRVGAGGLNEIEALIALAELETNTSYGNSGVSQQIRVVHSQEVAYVESGSTATDLPRLAGTSDGFIDEVHALRDLYGADVVSLWIESGGCGRGYLMTNISSGFESLAFNVVQRSCATGNLTFGHEIGHNMSLRHDWYVDQEMTPQAYHHGFVHVGNDLASSFRTVMAYGNRCSAVFSSSCSRLQHFSNPAILVGGNPTGVAAGTANSCVEGAVPVTECDADNAAALDDAALTVAAFRPTKVLARLTKEVSSEFVDIGDSISYTLTVTNDSGAVAQDIVIMDTVPGFTALDLGSLSVDASSTGVAPGSVITWTTGISLSSGDTLQRTFTVTAVAGGIVTNTATVDSSSTTLTARSNSVTTAVWESVSCGFSDGFESGALSHHWRIESTGDGRARVTSEVPNSGSFSAVLDDAVADGTYSEAALVLAADLAGMTSAQVDFEWAESGDENGAGDGVFIREQNGDPWVNVLNFGNSPDLVFQSASVDLVQAAANNSLTLTNGFQIRLQFYDNFPFTPGNPGGSDGYAIDDFALTCGCSYELVSAIVSGPSPTIEQSACVISAGPAYTVDQTGDLTLRSPQGVALRNGFSVLTGGALTVELAPLQ